MPVAANYCSRCGFQSAPERGACLMCSAPLGQKGEGTACPKCDTDNPSQATFCQGCGAALEAGRQPAPSVAASAGLVLEAAGDGMAGAAGAQTAELGGAGMVAGEVEVLGEEMAPLPLPGAIDLEESVPPPPPPADATMLEEEDESQSREQTQTWQMGSED